MNKKRIRFLAISFMAAMLAVAALRAYANYQESRSLIEVCDNGIAYVPRGTQYVKCHGKVRKVLLFETGETDFEDCACLDQKCCDGQCYIVIMTDPEENGSGDREKSSWRDGGAAEAGRNIFVIIWIPC
jgi:hypothetical protein